MNQHYVGVALEFQNSSGNCIVITLMSSPCKIRNLIKTKIDDMKKMGYEKLARITYTNASFGRAM